MFINGVQESTTTLSHTMQNGSGAFDIGAAGSGPVNTRFGGYISNLRVVKGTAVYTSNFTPPTEPLTAITNTQLLTCHLPYIADGSTNAHAITVTGNVSTKPLTPFNNLEYSEALHGSSGYFGGSGDYLQLPSDAGFSFGTGDFTVEAWVYYPPISNVGRMIIDSRPTSTNGSYWLFGTGSTGIISFVTMSTGGNTVADTVARPNQWVHYAATRSGTSLRLFANGTLVASTTDSSNISSASPTIGKNAYGSSDTWWLGNISNLRIVKGTAVYTSAFTPPTAPLTAVANTTFLMNPNPNIVDKAQKSNMTLVGDTTGSNTQQLFSSSTVKFDGTGDYLVVSSSSTDYGYGTGDFTIELWVYFNSVTATQTVVSNLTSASSTNPHLYLLNTDSKIKYYDGGGDRITSSALSANTWYHVALSRASGSTKLFIDGTQSGSTYTDSNNYGTTAPFVVGTYYSGGSLVTTTPLNGYVQDVRVTNGLARYTNSFTPPTTLLLG